MGAGPIADQTLGEARVRERFGVTVVAIQAAALCCTTHGDTVLRTGDRVRSSAFPTSSRRSGESGRLRSGAEGRPEREAKATAVSRGIARRDTVRAALRPTRASIWPPGSAANPRHWPQLLTWKPGRSPR